MKLFSVRRPALTFYSPGMRQTKPGIISGVRVMNCAMQGLIGEIKDVR